MLYIAKIEDYLKILTNDEVKDFVVVDFGEYFKCRTKSRTNSQKSC